MSTVLYVVILLGIVAVNVGEMVCPKVNAFWYPSAACINQCSQDKDTCEVGKKCCFTPEKPCGFRCLVAKNNKAKAGQCPPYQSEQKDINWRLCDAHLCSVDGDCRRRKKCCQNMCGGYVCIRPQ